MAIGDLLWRLFQEQDDAPQLARDDGSHLRGEALPERVDQLLELESERARGLVFGWLVGRPDHVRAWDLGLCRHGAPPRLKGSGLMAATGLRRSSLQQR
jgi:hypothetical protein